MSDRKLRRLERAWAQGDEDALRGLVARHLRADDKPAAREVLAQLPRGDLLREVVRSNRLVCFPPMEHDWEHVQTVLSITHQCRVCGIAGQYCGGSYQVHGNHAPHEPKVVEVLG